MSSRITFISHAATPAMRRAAFAPDESIGERELARLRQLSWVAPRAQQTLCAPERRTQDTAHGLGLHSLLEPALRDCDYGSWQGAEWDKIADLHPEALRDWLTRPKARPHGGESIASLVERVAHWLSGRHTIGHTLAIAHPAIIRAAVVHTLNAPLQSFWRIDISPLSITDLRFNGQLWSVRRLATPLYPND